ncbi:hypothetical protein [Streptomyces chartreusis]|uniref:hypothetical protein n=1 Tax=Streptomyces chartreusis TaxID=1969 RepID=UPI003644FB10
MRRIKVLEAIAGDDFSWSPGDVVELPDDEATQWADGHRADWAEAEGVAASVEQAPRVVTVDGRDLEVVSAVVEDFDAPGVEEDQPPHVRWVVTVELPDPEPDDPAPADPEASAEPKPEEDEVFDPADHKVDEILAYLATADEEEVLRVLDAEAAAKKPRSSLLNARDTLLAEARERAAGGEQQAAEKAAEVSRGGGRGDGLETRG